MEEEGLSRTCPSGENEIPFVLRIVLTIIIEIIAKFLHVGSDRLVPGLRLRFEIVKAFQLKGGKVLTGQNLSHLGLLIEDLSL